MIKRVSKTLSKNYLTTRLFLDDLEKIEIVLRTSAVEFQIVSEEYEFDSVDELRSNSENKRLTKLQIKSYKPYVSLDLNKYSVRLYCGSDDVQAAGIFYKIDEIVAATSLKPNFLYSYNTFWVANILSNLFALLLGLYTKSVWVYSAVTITLMAWVVWVVFIRLTRSSVIVLAKRGDTVGFMKRNADTIIVGLVVGIIVAIVTAVLTANYPVIQSEFTSLLKL